MEQPQPVRRVVVPVEGTDREFVVQEQAAQWAAALAVPVCGLHVDGAPDQARRDLWNYLERACDRWGVELETRVLAGTDPAEEVLAEVDALDLVVIGTRRLTGRFHLGSVTEAVLRGAPGPVQVVRLE